MTSIILLCPGQGAQRVGMGRAWAESSPAAREVFDRADRVLGDSLGAPLSSICFTGPEDRVNRTDAAQPALFACAVASFAAWSGGLGAPPSLAAAAGLSLGEWTALHLAGAMSFDDALRIVALRGRAMQDAAEASDGGMVALIGADETQARAVCADAAKGDVLVPANFNAPGQIVLSGHSAACDRAVPIAGSMGLRATKLAVAGAFHSPLMAPAAERLAKALESVPMQAPKCTVVSNVTALPHEADPASIKRRLIEQLMAPVRWDQSCSWLIANVRTPGGGASGGASGGAPVLHELAPGKVLAGLMRRIDKAAKVETHDEPG